MTDQGEGVVIETQVITQLVKVRLSKTERIIVVSVDELDIAKDKKPLRRKEVLNETSSQSAEPIEKATASDSDSEQQTSSKKRRRRRKKRKKSSPQNDDQGINDNGN